MEGYDTFEEFCRDTWDMDKRYANRTILATKTVDLLGSIGPILPSNEAQARELTRLETPQAQRDAWERVLELVKGGFCPQRILSEHPFRIALQTASEPPG